MRADQNAEYISKIRMRLCDDALARKVLLEQCQIRSHSSSFMVKT